MKGLNGKQNNTKRGLKNIYTHILLIHLCKDSASIATDIPIFLILEKVTIEHIFDRLFKITK